MSLIIPGKHLRLSSRTLFVILSLLYALAVSSAYNLVSVSDLPDGSGIQAILTQPVSAEKAVTKNTISFLVIKVRYETEDRLHVYISDANSTRWEIPQFLIPRPTAADLLPPSPTPKLEFSYTAEPFGFAVTRVPTREVLFNTTPGPDALFGKLVFQDLYLEISTSLPPVSSLYGLGESTRPDGLRLSPGRTYTLWNMDVAAVHTDVDLYGAFPYYLDVRENGSTHAVLLLNSNGMDVYYNGSFLTFKPIGGVLDFYFFAGPTPAQVLDQYTQLVGRPAPMPYWSFGFHQCRYGYKNVGELRDVVANYSAAKIPLEVMWSDIDYMDAFLDFTLDPVNYPSQEMEAFVNELHQAGQKYVIILDPGIHISDNYSAYTRGIQADIFIKNPSGDPFLGQVWPGAVHFPDFLNPNTTEYWTNEITEFHKVLAFDGLWIDMNEASNFCNGTLCTLLEKPVGADFTTCFLNCSATANTYYDNPPYAINVAAEHANLRQKIIGIDSYHAGGEIEYNTHNLYGLSEAIATNKALVSLFSTRPFVLSRSTFVGSGKHTAHWTGDNGATWNDLWYSIVSSLNTGLFGIPMVGADICGFQYNTTEELCARWIELGAFYPFSRNHADIHSVSHELYLWESVTNISRVVLGMRYRLLPYFYTLMYEAHTTGAPIARPLFFEYPEDPATLEVDAQYLLGKSVLVSPVIYEGARNVTAYFPAGFWYNIFDYSLIVDAPAGKYFTLDAPLDVIHVHVAAGSIIPLQEPLLTTAVARKSPFTLLVVFSGTVDQFEAAGYLFLDDGESLEMALGPATTEISFAAGKSGNGGYVTAFTPGGGYALQQNLKVETIVILGLASSPDQLNLDGQPVNSLVSIKQDNHSRAVEISKLTLPLAQNFSITW